MTHVARIETGPLETDADALVLGIQAHGEFSVAAQAVDDATGGAITRLIEEGEIETSRQSTSTLLGLPGIPSRVLVVTGLGAREELNREAAYTAAAGAARTLASRPRSRVAFFLEEEDWDSNVAAAGVAGALVGCVGQDLYRAKKSRHPFEEVLWFGSEAAIAKGTILGESINLTRRVVNEPPDKIYPETFAAEAAAVADQFGLEIETWDEHRLAEERAGSLMAVARGSARPPRLVILRHAGGGAKDPWLALCGKGVTFDSGGLSLKPSDSMKTMKCDMAGAATVLGAMQAISRLKLPVNVIGLMGLVENLPSATAFKLGDVLTARSGTTIEVLNTDAEGRLVLADVLNVAIERGATQIIDLATLTGACMVALGTDVAGLMTNNQPWCDKVAAAAELCGESAWQLPMFESYNDDIKSDIADIKNIGKGRWGGAITAAKFLERFVENVPWVHMDIAGPAFYDSPKNWIDGGGSGVMVRSLVEIAEHYGDK